MKRVVLLGAGVLALGLVGCNQFGTASPQRKAGLWERTVQGDQSPAPMVSKWCFDAASDRLMPVLGRRQNRGGPMASVCKSSMAKNGDSYVSDAQCNFGGASMTNHSVVSGDFSTQYTVVRTINIANSPEPARNGAHKVTETWVYKGACPPEIGAGQVKLPTGDVVDMASLRQGRGGGGGGGGPGGGGGGGGGGPPPG